TPQLKGPSDYQRHAQLVEIARLAAYGSTIHLHILCRMGKADRATAWRFSKIEIKSRLRAMFEVSTDD
ncbi:MAG: hypothetical protein DCF17_00930, partial [Shackletoniella antarctica]